MLFLKQGSIDGKGRKFAFKFFYTVLEILEKNNDNETGVYEKQI